MLNEQVFASLNHARAIIEAWRHDYNHLRPHSSLGALTPIEFADQQRDRPLEPIRGSKAVPLLNCPTRGRSPGRILYFACTSFLGAGHTSTDSTDKCGYVGMPADGGRLDADQSFD